MERRFPQKGKPALGTCGAQARRSDGPTATMLWGNSAWAIPRQRGGGDANSRASTTALRGGEKNRSWGCTTVGGEETARRGRTGRAIAPPP